MNWKLRHQGSPRTIAGLNPQLIVEGLQDGRWEATDEVLSPGSETWTPIREHPHFAEAVEEMEEFVLEPKHEEETHVDMIPLIDVTQVLLIFFILSTTYSQSATMIEAPGVSADKAGPRAVSKEEVETTMIR